ncbi:autotransporter domain-containing protein [Stutzerimonas urumqiensis]|uniref:autotransporter domain-containing protein n=1 Tax=Stutzerimonas urumqiensis TaxID=638269 RepID=UPI003BABF20E
MRGVLKPLAAALAVAVLPGMAQAEPFSQLVIFGDSLSDSGQFPDIGSPLFSGFPTGGLRFTNRTGPTYLPNNTEYIGKVSTQLLAERLGLQALPSTPILPSLITGNPDGTNYAVGGYRTDQILASIVAEDGSVVDPGLPGIAPRVRDGYLIDYPSVDGDTLFYLNGGGNDIFQGRNVDAASAALVAADLTAGVAALQAAGARYVIVSDLPDVGATPAGIGSGASAFWTARTRDFNTALDAQLAALGGNIIRTNFNGLLTEVRADLATYGFDPAVAQTVFCFDGSGGTCLEHPVYGQTGTAPDPDRLMFNDGVHPTTAVQRISADYLYALVAAPWEITLLPEMGLSSLRAHLRQLDNHLAASRGHWQPVGRWSVAVDGGYGQPNYDGDEGGVEGDGRSLTLGVTASHRLDEHWLAGVRLSAGDNRLELGEADSRYDMRSLLASGFARYEQNRVFADFSASAGHLDYDDLQRSFALGIAQRTEKGDTDGWVWGLGAKAGLNLFQPGEALKAGPFVGVSYQRVEVHGYDERGNRSTALSYDEQERRSLQLSAGVFVDYAMSPRTRLLGEIARISEREDDPDELRLGLTSVPGNRFTLPGYVPPEGQTRFGVGLVHTLDDGLSLRAHYDYLGQDDRQQSLALSLAWQM